MIFMASGVDFIIKVGTPAVKIAGQQGGSLSRSSESVEVTTKDTQGWKAFVSSFKEWSIEADGLVVDSDAGYQDLEDAFNAGTEVDVELVTGGATKYTGKAIITDFPIEFPYDSEVTYNVTLQGTGPLTKGATS